MLSGGSADRTGQPLAVLPLTAVAYSLRVNILLASLRAYFLSLRDKKYARSEVHFFVKKALLF